jgi:tetratricopeptide (TPR) repeat protein
MGQTEEWLDEAVRRHESGDLDEAAPLYERVLRLDPGHAGALYHLGRLELSRANAAAGVELLRQAASKQPDAADVHQSLGVAYKRLGEWGNAAQAFERALAIDPGHAPSFFELADLSQTLGRIDTAIDFFLRTINLDSSNTEAFRRLGELLFARENWVGAENCFARVVDAGHLNRDVNRLAELMSKLGIALIRQEKLDQAAQVYRRILGILPGMAEIYSNLAFVYERQGRLEEAVAAGLRAVELKPLYAEGHNNLGVAYRAVHQLGDARRCFARAAEIRPGFALAQFNLGTIDLMQGDYRSGWRGYEWRNLTLSNPPREFSVPRWGGQPIPGKTLLVHAEQGYGDTIQFARFLKMARVCSKAQVILEGPAALLPLLRELSGADVVLQAGVDLPTFDAEIPLPSLPGALGIDVTGLPRDIPYFTVPAPYRAAWRERMPSPGANDDAHRAGLLRVGFVWAGNPAQQQNVVRSCALSNFAGLARIPGVAWFSLQKEADATALRSSWPADCRVVALGPMQSDFADTAAAICELDLVIAVDTAVAHLAGALGRPTWTLLSHTPDWRWQLDGTDSLWYPTMRLFRQPRWGDWNAVFANVAETLQAAVAERGPSQA